MVADRENQGESEQSNACRGDQKAEERQMVELREGYRSLKHPQTFLHPGPPRSHHHLIIHHITNPSQDLCIHYDRASTL